MDVRSPRGKNPISTRSSSSKRPATPHTNSLSSFHFGEFEDTVSRRHRVGLLNLLNSKKLEVTSSPSLKTHKDFYAHHGFPAMVQRENPQLRVASDADNADWAKG
jgi:hypothetical protein